MRAAVAWERGDHSNAKRWPWQLVCWESEASAPRAGEFTMTNEEPLPKKVRLSEADFKVLPRDELILRWKQYEAYVQALEGKYTDLNSNDVTGLRESEEKLKQQQQESARRENILVMRLATKEQEMQECTWAPQRRAWLRLLYFPHQNQIQYLKQVQQPSVAQLRSTMVDPAINLFFLKMKGELEQTKDKLEQAQNELSAWKFTPDRGLMASDCSEEMAIFEKSLF
ncbi:pre-mRNA-splicing regulator WTAP [Grus japonensis]|uniref:Pre-mRNA-splicing regulator WTAP n=1 Tax=Grus japonensis TaxID=30415 RepID=A0ABC9WN91_GRUJA